MDKNKIYYLYILEYKTHLVILKLIDFLGFALKIMKYNLQNQNLISPNKIHLFFYHTKQSEVSIRIQAKTKFKLNPSTKLNHKIKE